MDGQLYLAVMGIVAANFLVSLVILYHIFKMEVRSARIGERVKSLESELYEIRAQVANIKFYKT